MSEAKSESYLGRSKINKKHLLGAGVLALTGVAAAIVNYSESGRKMMADMFSNTVGKNADFIRTFGDHSADEIISKRWREDAVNFQQKWDAATVEEREKMRTEGEWLKRQIDERNSAMMNDQTTDVELIPNVDLGESVSLRKSEGSESLGNIVIAP